DSPPPPASENARPASVVLAPKSGGEAPPLSAREPQTASLLPVPSPVSGSAAAEDGARQSLKAPPEGPQGTSGPPIEPTADIPAPPRDPDTPPPPPQDQTSAPVKKGPAKPASVKEVTAAQAQPPRALSEDASPIPSMPPGGSSMDKTSSQPEQA